MSDELTELADRIDAWSNLVSSGYEVPAAGKVMNEAASALRTLASQAKQEPVAWRWRTRPEDNWTFSASRLSLNDIGRTAPTFQERPLYTAPQKPQPAAGWNEGAAHFTDAQLDTMYEASKRDAQFVGSEIRQLIGDIRTARKAIRSSQSTSDAGGGMRVKPLHWIRSKVFGSYKWRGVGAFGEFAAVIEDHKTHDQIVAEKAHIQADYEKQIRSALSKPAPVARYSIEFDGFTGTVIGSYTTLEGKEGVVLQQDGTRVVHVYGRKHLKPAPVAADASAVLQNDLGEMLRALGMSDAAQPKSPHEVFQSALAEMKRHLANASAEARVLPDWMASLPMQQQSVLVLALRGPDGIRKHHPCKDIVRYYRGTVLKAARFGRLLHADEKADTFMGMQGFSDEATFRQVMGSYFDCIDELPHHYHMHLMHGAEILGYKHPDELYRKRWFSFYLACLNDSHTPQGETERQMDDRLSDWGRKQWESTTLSAHPHASACDKQGER